MAWWSADDSIVRLSCPGCGHFDLFLDRSNGKPKLECRGCGISGFAKVTAAFDAWRQAQNPTQRSDDTSLLSPWEKGAIRKALP